MLPVPTTVTAAGTKAEPLCIVNKPFSRRGSSCAESTDQVAKPSDFMSIRRISDVEGLESNTPVAVAAVGRPLFCCSRTRVKGSMYRDRSVLFVFSESSECPTSKSLSRSQMSASTLSQPTARASKRGTRRA